MKYIIKKRRKSPWIFLPRIIRKEASFVFVLPENIYDKDGIGSIRILGVCTPLFRQCVVFKTTQSMAGIRAYLDIGWQSLPLGELIPGVEYYLRFVLTCGKVEVHFGYKDSYQVKQQINIGKLWFMWLLRPAMLGSYRTREDVSIKIKKLQRYDTCYVSQGCCVKQTCFDLV